MAVLGLCCCTGFTLVVMLGLLTAVASPAMEHGLLGAQASAIVAPGL